jgi:murein DD-endopeptidase MepM/ murein hydrolase activator NlpD
LNKLTSENLAREGKVIGPKFRTCSASKMWQGRFVFPAQGPISSPFGRQRVYGDGKLSWHHKGVDIAGPLGDSVRACGAGTVILSQDFVVHGKTIMIDHGHGVVSIYCHLNEIIVDAGDAVEAGELIGAVGQTGVSTGPHVHWGVSVGNTRVDPVDWVNRSVR